MLEQFEFSEKVKEEIIGLVLYQGQPAQVVAKKYGLPNIHIITNWIRIHKRSWKRAL